ncbi:MAG: transcriptional regulator, family [Planctomycetaceae bacterium]|nr:transcriptional regulator, family [Planctomycetaceae bacterium]
MADTSFTSVSKMLNAMSDDEAFNKNVSNRIAERTVTKTLQAMRIAKDISQERIASELKCSQSRISKIESSNDATLRLEEVGAYAMAFGCDLNIILCKRGETGVERIKRHAFAISEELERLAECAKDDDAIAKAVSSFFGEAFVNIVRMIQNASEKLPVRAIDGKPHITITESCDEASLAICEDSHTEVQPRRPVKKSAPRKPLAKNAAFDV